MYVDGFTSQMSQTVHRPARAMLAWWRRRTKQLTVCFDFDRTLAIVEVRNAAQAEASLLGGAGRVAMLRELLSKLRRASCRIAVCSFNTKANVMRVLGAPDIGLLDLFDEGCIFTRETFEQNAMMVPYNKGELLVALLLSPHASKPAQLLFTDDDPSHLRDVATAAPGCITVSSPKTGIGKQECDSIAAWAGVGPLMELLPAADMDSGAGSNDHETSMKPRHIAQIGTWRPGWRETPRAGRAA